MGRSCPLQNAYSAQNLGAHIYPGAGGRDQASRRHRHRRLRIQPRHGTDRDADRHRGGRRVEDKLKRFPAIVRMWAKPPEVPAAKAVWIASSATDGKTGEIYNILTPAQTAARRHRRGGAPALRRGKRHRDRHGRCKIHTSLPSANARTLNSFGAGQAMCSLQLLRPMLVLPVALLKLAPAAAGAGIVAPALGVFGRHPLHDPRRDTAGAAPAAP